MKEFQALALDVELCDENDNVINVDEELNKEDTTLEYSPSDMLELEDDEDEDDYEDDEE